MAALVLAARGQARDRVESWREVRSPHFIVVSNAGEKQARRVAGQFERIRSVFQMVFPRARVDPPSPIVVIAAKDEKTFKPLEPESWLQKGQARRTGMLLRAPEKNFVLLRLNTEGSNPYQTVFHEYTHLLVNQGEGAMPLWLDEGVAEFFANSEIHEKEVWLGKPSESHVMLLRESKRLPLASLFAVDHESPYYNEGNKASIFYAESWALTHYLMIKDLQEKKSRLRDFLAAINRGADPKSAAAQAFGELREIERDLESYVRQSNFKLLRMKGSTDVDEEAFVARELSPADSNAIRGDFLTYNRRFSDARALLEEALRQNPKHALAEESLGFLEFQQGHREEAKRRLAEAVKLNSQSYLANYYYAVLALQGTAGPDDSAQVEASLRKAIQINPSFAPAYQALAAFYAGRGENLEEAHMLALHAVQLEPGNINNYLTVGNLMLRMHRPDSALGVGERARSLAKSVQERAAVDSLVDNAQRLLKFIAAQKQAEEAAPQAAEQNQRELTGQPTSADRVPAQIETKNSPRLRHREGRARGQRDLVEGTVTEVKCSAPAMLDLTLRASIGTMAFHTDNYYEVEWRAGNFTPTGALLPCTQIQEMKARIVFVVLRGQPDAGEIVSVELRK